MPYNPKSLANLHRCTSEEASEMARKSQASPKRKRNKMIRQIVEEYLCRETECGTSWKEYIFGFVLVEKAASGDLKAIEMVANILGEGAGEVVEVASEVVEVKRIERIHKFLDWQKERGNMCYLYGTTRSGKTYAVCQWLCEQLKTGGLRGQILIAGQTLPFLRNGCAAYMRDIAPLYGLEVQDNGLRVNGANGVIVLQSFEKPERVLSSQWAAVFVNEGNVIPINIIDGLRIRCSGLLIADFNPSCADWWGKDMMNDANSLFCTFQDNPFLGDNQLAAIESIRERGEAAPIGSYAYWYYQVYYLGRFSEMGGGVFTRLRRGKPSEWDTVGLPVFHGVDFGDTGDPNALVAVMVDKDESVVHVMCQYYQTATDDKTMTAVLLENGVQNLIFETATGGNTRAKNFRAFGYTGNLYPCRKEQVAQSVFNLSTWTIVCYDDISASEFQNYRLDGGKFRGADHCIDATRYACGLIFTNSI